MGTAFLWLNGGVFLAPAIPVIASRLPLAVHGAVIVEAKSMAATTQFDFA